MWVSLVSGGESSERRNAWSLVKQNGLFVYKFGLFVYKVRACLYMSFRCR